MKEISFNEWWKSKENEILNVFSHWSDIEKKLKNLLRLLDYTEYKL